jgi:NitT/TauT family transport system substrate-binding protein
VPGGSLIVSNQTLAEKPDVVRGLIAGLNKGIEFCKENPMEAAKIMKKYWDTTLADEVVAEQVRETVEAIPDGAGKPLGWIDPATLQTSLEQMKEAGKIDEVFEVDRYYSNEFNPSS